MVYDDITASSAKVQISVVRVSAFTWSKSCPRLQMTRANSDTWERLMVDTAASLLPPPSRKTTRKIPIHLTERTTTAIKSAFKSVSMVGTGICMPKPTKNSVMKKSRMYLILPLNSALYGNVASATPDMREASSKERPMNGRMAKHPMKKHQAKESTSMSSTCLEEDKNTAGITIFAYSIATTSSKAIMAKVFNNFSGCGFARSG
mmetsp:Transcript_24932/g.57901  ORF Transcript_24932/g.57901 Transcript_24932/m.57901 type:complete len:205 (-) Transcript_24932:1275-1889(-)